MFLVRYALEIMNRRTLLVIDLPTTSLRPPHAVSRRNTFGKSRYTVKIQHGIASFNNQAAEALVLYINRGQPINKCTLTDDYKYEPLHNLI